MNPVAIIQFFEVICTEIYKRFLAAMFIKSGLLGTVLTYFGTVKINS